MRTLDSSHYLIRVSLKREEIPADLASKYPFDLPIIRHFSSITFHPKVTYLVGENGSGKSTLLEAIAIGMGFNAEGGSRNFHFSTMDSHSPLHNYLRLSRGVRRPRDGYFLRAESFYNVASEIERLDESGGGPPIKSYYNNQSLHEQSHGESFITLMEHRFGGNALYILDEPEAALSPARQLKLLALMHKHIAAGSQFIIATHSPILMAYPEATIYAIDNGHIAKAAYESTEHFQLTKYFLDNREKVLKELFT
ncbi:MAG TPA: AAA family ATPase [Ktedonobacteraceae bacterium]|nr:AAA family ATPase [Ktedonobacteraceae bacterium]